MKRILLFVKRSTPRFNTLEPHPDHEVYPYLLKDLKIDHSILVCAMDIMYTKKA